MSTKEVIVTEDDVEQYLSKGYRKSVRLPVEVMPGLQPHLAKGLVVLEIGEAKHEALNAPPVRWRVGSSWRNVAFPFVEKLELLEEGKSTSVVGTFNGAEYRETDQLFKEKRQALLSAEPWIREQLQTHRRAIEELEKFLKANEL